MRGKQPDWKDGDDKLRLDVVRDKLLITTISPSGQEASIVVSEFNAWALIGLLSLFVGLKLPPAVAKRICL